MFWCPNLQFGGFSDKISIWVVVINSKYLQKKTAQNFECQLKKRFLYSRHDLVSIIFY